MLRSRLRENCDQSSPYGLTGFEARGFCSQEKSRHERLLCTTWNNMAMGLFSTSKVALLVLENTNTRVDNINCNLKRRLRKEVFLSWQHSMNTHCKHVYLFQAIFCCLEVQVLYKDTRAFTVFRIISFIVLTISIFISSSFLTLSRTKIENSQR